MLLFRHLKDYLRSASSSRAVKRIARGQTVRPYFLHAYVQMYRCMFYRQLRRGRVMSNAVCQTMPVTTSAVSTKELLVSNWRLYTVKLKWSRYRSGVAQRVGRGIALLFHDRGTRRGEWSAARPGRTLPPGKTRYPIYRRLVGPQGRSGRAENIVPTGIRSRTVQRVASRYTDWATGPQIYILYVA